MDCSMKIFANYFNTILCGWEGSRFYEFDLIACNKLYTAMTRTLVGGICGGSQCVGKNCAHLLMRVSHVAGV